MNVNEDVQHIINAAYHEAKQRNHEYLTPEHVLFASLFFDVPREVLAGCGADPDELQQTVAKHLEKHSPIAEGSEPIQTVGFQTVIERAFFHTQAAHKEEVDIGDILVSIYDEEESYGSYFLKKAGIARVDLLEAVSHGPIQERAEQSKEQEERREAGEGAEEQPQKKRKGASALEQFTTELTQLAREDALEPLIGRELILERTIQVLCRRLKNNPVHVGDPGVGKTAITEGLAQMIASGKVPKLLRDYKVYSLDMGSMLAGTRFRGDFEERMKKVIAELQKQEKVILFIDEIHTVIGAGAVSGGAMDAANLLKPALASGKLRCIGSTTHEEHRKYFEKDRALSRRFQKIEVPETTTDETYQILLGLREKYESYHEITYTDEALRAAVDLSDQYINDRFLPDKAIDVIDEAGAWARLFAQAEPDGSKSITEREVEHVVSKIAQIPEKSVSVSEVDRLKNLQGVLKQVLFGQDQAIETVVQAVKRSRAGFRAANKPVASFLFVGPTGVGKTELARQLASEMGVPLHRFDMSEFQEKHTVARLVGAPPGYVGYDEGGLLTDSVRRNPHSVLLLDEIEKAHPDVFNVLLQIMDYATLTDNTGRKADFRNVIVIMTSNAGARDIGKPMIGFGQRNVTEQAIGDAVERTFSPEFRNRLDKVVVFNRLDQSIIEEIVRKEVLEFNRQLAEKNVRVEVTPDCVRWLAEKGYSPEFGARNMSRLVEEKVKTFFVDEVLFGDLAEGGVAVADVEDDDIVVRVKHGAEA